MCPIIFNKNNWWVEVIKEKKQVEECGASMVTKIVKNTIEKNILGIYKKSFLYRKIWKLGVFDHNRSNDTFD